MRSGALLSALPMATSSGQHMSNEYLCLQCKVVVVVVVCSANAKKIQVENWQRAEIIFFGSVWKWKLSRAQRE